MRKQGAPCVRLGFALRACQHGIAQAQAALCSALQVELTGAQAAQQGLQVRHLHAGHMSKSPIKGEAGASTVKIWARACSWAEPPS